MSKEAALEALRQKKRREKIAESELKRTKTVPKIIQQINPTLAERALTDTGTSAGSPRSPGPDRKKVKKT